MDSSRRGRKQTAGRNGAGRFKDVSRCFTGTRAGSLPRPKPDPSWLCGQQTAKSSGSETWVQRFSAPPAPTGDRLYLALKDGRILALALQTGEDIWTHKLAEPAVGILPVADRLFVGARDNQFYSLEADDAETDWRWRTGADLVGLPVLDARRVYFIALDNVLRGHNRGSGSMDWKRVLPMRPFTGPLLSAEKLLVAGVAAEIRAYSTHDGKPAGEYVLKGSENEEVLLSAPPHLTKDDLFILITRGGTLRAVGSAPTPGGEPEAVPPPTVSPATPSTDETEPPPQP